MKRNKYTTKRRHSIYSVNVGDNFRLNFRQTAREI